MKATLIKSIRSAGKILMEYLGKVPDVSRKQDQSNIVTEADVTSEQCIIEIIQRDYPDHNILAEESGFKRTASDLTWVIDPLDGTCNFAVGLPSFGVLMAVLKGNTPILGAAYLPFFDALYVSEAGEGVYRDDKQVHVSSETKLSDVLCAYNLDYSPDLEKTRKEAELFRRLVYRARNVRASNCLTDFCYTVDGRFGAIINQSTRIWDIAPFALMFKEAGGTLSDITGNPLNFELGDSYEKAYSVIGASSPLHTQILDLFRTDH